MTVSEPGFAVLQNGQCLCLDACPSIAIDAFVSQLGQSIAGGLRVCSYFAAPDPSDRVELFAILANDAAHQIHVSRTMVDGSSIPSLTPAHPQLHLFEREIAEQSWITFAGHPWLKPVRFVAAGFPSHDSAEPAAPGALEYYRVDSGQVHEVAVGPVHAGVIEPGHFRFQCNGERVLHLEISLGYQHRGIEEALVNGPHKVTLKQMETAAGDTTAGHAWAYCRNIEALSGSASPVRADAIRAIALELERLANHAGDLGALAGDVGFLPTAAFCGRIRGDFLNMTALLCGNRFSRDLSMPGGVRFDVDRAMAAELAERLIIASKDVKQAVSLLLESASVLTRFEATGGLTRDDVVALGLVGPPARASGIARDCRIDHPLGSNGVRPAQACIAYHGDVHARALVRWREIEQSCELVTRMLDTLPAGELARRPEGLAANSLAVTLVEGWRGEVCHVAVTGDDGRFRRYKITDPSFHNWMGLAIAMRDGEISDFPLCNKSFNLSYCGHDL